LGATLGAVGIKGTEIGAEASIWFATGASGLAASETSRKGGVGIAVGRIGLTDTETGAHGATALAVGAVGLTGSAAGQTAVPNTGSAVGAVGLTGAAFGVGTPAPAEPELVYRGHRKRHRPGDDVSYEDVVKAWELLELRRRAQAKRKPDADPEESLYRVSIDPLAPAAEVKAAALKPVLSPLLKIDLDAILTRKVFDDAMGEVERYNAIREAIAEVEETELLILMAIAAAEDDE